MQNNSPKFSVTEVTKAIKGVVEGSLVPCWIEGEISNWKIHSAGHCYFSLKDENSQIKAVLWRTYRSGLNFKIENGLKVTAYGAVKVYEKGGYYQFSAFVIKPAGIGELQLAFEQLKEKLQKEGLFDENIKKEIPTDASRIGIVTAQTGAALRDVINVITRRMPSAQIILNPVKVQGLGAANEIAKAIDDFNKYKKIDVLIVTRGGGSMEDLWAFNEEIVARAIYKSEIPIISAVGHEIDFTISDFVADMRAPTPSAGAELAVTDNNMRKEVLRTLKERLKNAIDSYIEGISYQLNTLTTNLIRNNPEDAIYQNIQKIDEFKSRIDLSIKHHIELKKRELSELIGKIESLSPLSIFARGYSITQLYKENKFISSINQISCKSKVKTILKDGFFISNVEKINKTDTFKLK